MNDDQFEDLKQFIDSRISQSERQIRGELQEVKGGLQRLAQKVDDGFAGVAEAIEQINEQCTDADKRLPKLEQQTAS